MTIHTLTTITIIIDCQGEEQTGDAKDVEGGTKHDVIGILYCTWG